MGPHSRSTLMPVNDLRIVFAGTPDFAASHLISLIQRGLNVVSTYSQPDRPRGRGKLTLPSPVKEVALANNIPVFQPVAFDSDHVLNELATQKPDIMIVVAYGLLLPQSVLDIPRLGCINVHASLLPRWRGAAPIERAILAGDKISGVSIMQMNRGLDTGPVLASASTPITITDNSSTLTDRLLLLGCNTLFNVLLQLAAGTASPAIQDDKLAIYARKLRKEEAGINWDNSALYIQQQVNAFYPRSPAYCFHQGQRLRIISSAANHESSTAIAGTILSVSSVAILVSCGHGSLLVSVLQLEGKLPMALTSLLNGHPDFFRVGQLLTSAHDHVQSN